MKFKKMIFAMLIAGFAAPAAMADLFVPWLAYRTGPYSPGGIPVADGFSDYMTLLNERDGGIGGEMIVVEECETAYNTQKGVECYEATKGKGALVYSPLSTGITYQLIPKATADGIPIHSMGYGRTAAADGTVFSHVFNFPAHYWDGASIAVNHILDLNEGDIKGKKIVLVYHNSAYGKEPIATLELLADKYEYELMLVPVDHPGQEQKAQWLQIRREKPDYILMWGWGVMNSVAINEAANIRFPMENFIGVWWSGSEADVLPAADRSNGYKALAINRLGVDYPAMDDMKKYVLDAGLAAGNGDQVGTVLYMRGVYGALLITEAIRVAQKMHGVTDITPEMMRDGLENLVITEELMTELGFPNFGPSFAVTCENHGGEGIGYVQQWNAKDQEWTIISEAIQSEKEIIDKQIADASAAYAEENNIQRRCL